jgi:tryptophan halogenase
MNDKPVRRIVVVGGGTAGWMSATLLSNILLKGGYTIRLIESDEIGIVGVGEATIPPIRLYNAAISLDENEFLRRTKGTFKLGIEFVNWGRIGESYMHGFGKIGMDWNSLPCYQYWLKMRQQGKVGDADRYSINTAASRQNKFMRGQPEMKNSPLADIAYAFHFDATLYAAYLRELGEKQGVLRTEGKIVDVALRPEDGFIDHVVMESGEKIHGDIFLDCSGIRALLIEGALKTGYEDWNHWLPCDRAIAVPCEPAGPLMPMTRSTAHKAGWQWRIPLQHRTGNGHVYASRFMEQDEATDILMRNLDGKALAEPRLIRFLPGKRKKVWNRNCVAVGLSSGFLEPLESTSIHLIQTTIVRLTRLLPNVGIHQAEIDEFNRQVDFDYDRIRDFIILHYKQTHRDDSPMWNYCRTMPVPDTLQHKMDLFRANGRFVRESDELFTDLSWFQVMIGQGLHPRGYDAIVEQSSDEEVMAFLTNVEQVIAKCVAVMPLHADFIAKQCAVRG